MTTPLNFADATLTPILMIAVVLVVLVAAHALRAGREARQDRRALARPGIPRQREGSDDE